MSVHAYFAAIDFHQARAGDTLIIL